MKPLLPPIFALPAFALALLSAPAGQAQESAPNLNVIVNDSALDRLPSGGEEPLLPAPDRRPISRLLMLPSGQIVGAADVATSSEATVSAVPTTPIQSTELGEPGSETATETAAATPAAEPAPETTAGELPAEAEGQNLLDGQIRIPYEEESAVIPETIKGRIVGLIEKMNADYSLHLQVLAYARGDDDEIGRARGVSLARALAMRNFLVENGLDLSRMDVRALGNTAQEDPGDRVDLIPLVQ